KAAVDDMRESPSFTLMDHLTAQGAEVSYYDPYIPQIGPTREHAHWTGTTSVAWTKEALAGFDAALIATDHPGTDYQLLVDSVDTSIDTRTALAKAGVQAKNLWMA